VRLVIVGIYLSQLTEQTDMKCGRLVIYPKRGKQSFAYIGDYKKNPKPPLSPRVASTTSPSADPTRKESNFCLDNVNYQSPPTTRYHVFLNLTPSIFHKENHMKSMSFQAIVLPPTVKIRYSPKVVAVVTDDLQQFLVGAIEMNQSICLQLPLQITDKYFILFGGPHGNATAPASNSSPKNREPRTQGKLSDGPKLISTDTDKVFLFFNCILPLSDISSLAPARTKQSKAPSDGFVFMFLLTEERRSIPTRGAEV
jgi:hypothetical protein